MFSALVVDGSPPDGCEILHRESFCADLRGDIRRRECCCYLVRGKAGGAKVVGKRLALLSEGLFQESDEWRFFYAQFCESRCEIPAEDRRVDFGWRNKGFRRQRKECFDAPVELQGYGKQAVVARSRACCNAVGYLTLDHDNGAVERGGVLREAKEDWRGDVVRQISDDEQTFACNFLSGREIEVKYVLAAYGDVESFFGQEALLEGPGQFAVQFDGNEMFGLSSEQLSDRAFAGADFDNGARADWSQRGYDALDGLRIAEKILSKLRFCGHAWSFC